MIALSLRNKMNFFKLICILSFFCALTSVAQQQTLNNMLNSFYALNSAAERTPNSLVNITFLHLASENPQVIYLERSLAIGADINCTNSNGDDALMIIVRKYGDRQLPAIRFLLEQGINFHTNNTEGSVISIARENYFTCTETFEIFRRHIWPKPQS